MDVERSLCSKIITTGQIENVVARKINAGHFYDEDCAKLFTHLLSHVKRYKIPPSLEAVEDYIKEANLDFDLVPEENALDYLIDKFIETIKWRTGTTVNEDLARALYDPERRQNIEFEFMDAARQVATAVPGMSVSRLKDVERRITEYEKRKDEDEPLGLPFGFPSLDDWTGGIQPHEFVGLQAFTGIGKTTLATRFAATVWAQGYTPLYISLEMEASVLLRKVDAMLANLDYWALKHMRLSDDDMDSWREYARQVAQTSADIPVIDKIRHCTVDHVFAETTRHVPDVVIVDFVQLMRGDRTGNRWDQLEDIAYGLKENARVLGIPVVAAVQSNRGGAKEGGTLENVAGGIAINMAADIVIGLHQDDKMFEIDEMEMRMLKNRDGKRGSFRCVWNHETMTYREKGHYDMTHRKDREVSPNGKASTNPFRQPNTKLRLP